MLRYTIYFTGHVQGVGFRYNTRSIAANHPVAGYVQNLPDGRVLLVAEGKKTDLDRFIDDLSSSMGQFIRTQTLDQVPATLQFGHPDTSPLTIRN